MPQDQEGLHRAADSQKRHVLARYNISPCFMLLPVMIPAASRDWKHLNVVLSFAVLAASANRPYGAVLLMTKLH